LTGAPPFVDENPFAVYEKILQGNVEFPETIDSRTRDFLRRLLTVDRTRRLGAGGSGEVKAHSVFEGVLWEGFMARTAEPPWVPTLEGDDDTCCFEACEVSRECFVRESSL
jgi:hypothetical protein